MYIIICTRLQTKMPRLITVRDWSDRSITFFKSRFIDYSSIVIDIGMTLINFDHQNASMIREYAFLHFQCRHTYSKSQSKSIICFITPLTLLRNFFIFFRLKGPKIPLATKITLISWYVDIWNEKLPYWKTILVHYSYVWYTIVKGNEQYVQKLTIVGDYSWLWLTVVNYRFDEL